MRDVRYPADLCRLAGQGGEVHLLPALPAAWPDGRVRGLRARGGWGLDIQWQGGRLRQATLRASVGGKCKVRYGQIARELSLAAGHSRLDSALGRAPPTTAGLSLFGPKVSDLFGLPPKSPNARKFSV
ncbi:MAG: hypothetical protein NTZ98_08555 [Acidobacteria bacterium]|nr:hypothetical protein [Acidobacteriota bacterium]